MPRPRTKFAWQAPHEGSHLQFAAAVEFSRKLRRLMAKKGFSQSDLARECWGEEETRDGYMAARGRDKINKYCAGKTIPDADTLKLLARALEVPESELAPVVVGTAAERENPEVRMTVIAGHRELVHMSWNTVMPLHVALQMLALYQMTETRGPTEKEMVAQAQPYNTTDARVAEAMTAAARALVTNLEVSREKVREDREAINDPAAQPRLVVSMPPGSVHAPARGTRRRGRAAATVLGSD
jgi:transcriptional regulator with XRE-family HTH domain